MIFDEYLKSFMGDIGNLITGIFNVLELLLGISYFCGQILAEWISIGGEFVLEAFLQILDCMRIMGSELWDFGVGIVKGILLIYYAVWMVFESFYVIALDLKSFSTHVFISIGELLNDTQSAMLYHSSRIFSAVPGHLCDSLMFVGGSTLIFFRVLLEVLQDFVQQVVLAPMNVIRALGTLLLKLTQVPLYLYESVPLTAHVGLAVVIIMCTMYWKLSFINVCKAFFNVLKQIFAKASQAVTILKNSKRIATQVLQSTDFESETFSKFDTKALCVICQDETVSFISMPCKHVCLCYTCVKALVECSNKCPLCRANVTKFERVYIPL